MPQPGAPRSVADTVECHRPLLSWRTQCHELQILTSPEVTHRHKLLQLYLLVLLWKLLLLLLILIFVYWEKIFRRRQVMLHS